MLKLTTFFVIAAAATFALSSAADPDDVTLPPLRGPYEIRERMLQPELKESTVPAQTVVGH